MSNQSCTTTPTSGKSITIGELKEIIDQGYNDYFYHPKPVCPKHYGPTRAACWDFGYKCAYGEHSRLLAKTYPWRKVAA